VHPFGPVASMGSRRNKVDPALLSVVDVNMDNLLQFNE
jgi:hypothetical protein